MDAALCQLLRAAERILVFTGAGVSTECGIPDYRGPQGVWKTRQPVYYQEFLDSEEARVDYWEQKADDWERYRDATPGKVHHACVAIEQAGRLEAVVTQNIDGLHGKAGTSGARLIEIHGTNAQVQCQTCSRRSDPDPCFASFRATRRAPRCDCGGLWKPATISFGQQLVPEVLRQAGLAAKSCDLVIALGSTLSVHPAAAIPLVAAQRGAPYVVVNRGPTDHDGLAIVRLRLDGDVGEIFGDAVAAAFA
jgi:NAD-dependent deacetylase